MCDGNCIQTAHEYLFGMGKHTLSIETRLLILDVSSHYPQKKYTSLHLRVIFIILKRIQHFGWTPHQSSPRFMLYTMPTACWIFVKILTGLIAFLVFEHVWWLRTLHITHWFIWKLLDIQVGYLHQTMVFPYTSFKYCAFSVGSRKYKMRYKPTGNNIGSSREHNGGIRT